MVDLIRKRSNPQKVRSPNIKTSPANSILSVLGKNISLLSRKQGQEQTKKKYEQQKKNSIGYDKVFTNINKISPSQTSSSSSKTSSCSSSQTSSSSVSPNTKRHKKQLSKSVILSEKVKITGVRKATSNQMIKSESKLKLESKANITQSQEYKYKKKQILSNQNVKVSQTSVLKQITNVPRELKEERNKRIKVANKSIVKVKSQNEENIKPSITGSSTSALKGNTRIISARSKKSLTKSQRTGLSVKVNNAKKKKNKKVCSAPGSSSSSNANSGSSSTSTSGIQTSGTRYSNEGQPIKSLYQNTNRRLISARERQELYALNFIMTGLERDNFQRLCQEKGYKSDS